MTTSILHGTMEDYFATKARALRAGTGPPRGGQPSMTTGGAGWPRRPPPTAALTRPPTVSESRVPEPAGHGSRPRRTGTWAALGREGIWAPASSCTAPAGNSLHRPHRTARQFNISNAALAVVMVLFNNSVPARKRAATGDGTIRRRRAVQAALDARTRFTLEVPGRMQLVGSAHPAAIVDFAHNPGRPGKGPGGSRDARRRLPGHCGFWRHGRARPDEAPADGGHRRPAGRRRRDQRR